MLILRGGRIMPIIGAPFTGDIAIENGKIAALGEHLDVPGAEIRDVSGRYVMPGLVDAHSHVGVFESGTREVDHNEKIVPVTPEMRILDSIFVHDIGFREAMEYGITTSVVCPGSINLIGGTCAALKSCGNTVEEMLVSTAVAMKMALGENPKFRYSEMGKSPKTRMGSAAIIREALSNARRYQEKKERCGEEASYDFRMEALLPVLRREIPMKIHCHRADDIMTAIRIMDEFGLLYTLDHCTEGYRITDALLAALERNCVGIILGPTMNRKLKLETRYKLSTKTGKQFYDAGIPFATCTDFPDSMHETLMLVAGRTAAEGVPEEAALRSVTIEPARITGLSDRIGSLEVGKDADIAVYSGYPLEFTSVVIETYINGRLCYSRDEKENVKC